MVRGKGYHKYNSKENIMSQVFVINTEESNIKTIDKDNDFLNNLYITLFEQYDFNVDNAAIYYLFDRDYQSNTDVLFINKMISTLGNARDNGGYDRQGLLLLSYYFSVRKGERKGMYSGRYYCDYDRDSLDDLLDSFDNIEIIDIWKTSDARGDEQSKWYNVLLRKISKEKE